MRLFQRSTQFKLHPRLEAFERSIVYCVPYGGRPDDSRFTLAGQNLFLNRNRVVSRSTKTGVSFTNHVTQRALERCGAKETPAQAVAAALAERMGLIVCFFRHAVQRRGPNVIIPGLDGLLLGEIYQPTDQKFVVDRMPICHVRSRLWFAPGADRN